VPWARATGWGAAATATAQEAEAVRAAAAKVAAAVLAVRSLESQGDISVAAATEEAPGVVMAVVAVAAKRETAQGKMETEPEVGAETAEGGIETAKEAEGKVAETRPLRLATLVAARAGREWEARVEATSRPVG